MGQSLEINPYTNNQFLISCQTIFWKKGNLLKSVGNTDVYIEKNKIRPIPHTIYKNQLNIKDLSLRPETMEQLEENEGKMLSVTVIRDNLLDKEQATKAKQEQIELCQIQKDFCSKGNGQ